MLKAKPCPFCGFKVDPEDLDTLYPSGAWRDEPGLGRVYLKGTNPTADGKVYKLSCNTIYGGCGAEMHGDSIDEVLTKWNTRVGE